MSDLITQIEKRWTNRVSGWDDKTNGSFFKKFYKEPSRDRNMPDEDSETISARRKRIKQERKEQATELRNELRDTIRNEGHDAVGHANKSKKLAEQIEKQRNQVIPKKEKRVARLKEELKHISGKNATARIQRKQHAIESAENSVEKAHQQAIEWELKKAEIDYKIETQDVRKWHSENYFSNKIKSLFDYR